MKKEENKSTIMKCNQTQCGFMQAGHGCQKCSVCGAEPYMISETCQECFDCEYKPGHSRWGENNDNELKDTEGIKKEKEKILVPQYV